MTGNFSDVNVHLVKSTDEVFEFKRWLGERHENDAIAVDTETTGFDPLEDGATIRLIQFGDTMRGWSVPWEDWRGLARETLETYEGEPISVGLPTTVDLEVVWAEAAIAGDTANAPTKQVELETGLKLQAPMFVNEGDTIRVDTRDGSYVTRVQK